MNPRRLGIGAALTMALFAVGCSHRVVANPDEHTVKLYRDEATYERIKDLKKQGGPMAMIGNLGEGFVAKEIGDNTPVRIVAQDSEGAQVEITDGPDKGATGFVAKNNVD